MKQFLLVHGKGFVKPQYNRAIMQVYDESFFIKENGWEREAIAELELGMAVCLDVNNTCATVVRIV